VVATLLAAEDRLALAVCCLGVAADMTLRFLDALAAGERSPKALAALGDCRLKASTAVLENALTGRFRDIHAFEIAVHLRLIDAINAEIARLDEAIGRQLSLVPRIAPCCTTCGEIGGGHAPGCRDEHTPVLGLAERLDEITGAGECNAKVIIAELGTDPSQFPAPGHAAAWTRLTPRTRQSGKPPSPAAPAKATGTCAARSARPR
jgi:transposase